MTHDAEIRIGIVGDYEPGRASHEATTAALDHAAAATGRPLSSQWLPTSELAGTPATGLAHFDGLFIAPGSPYRSMEGALRGIRFARECDVPLIGTCGGFQHVIIEYARHVLGITRADYAEDDVTAEGALVTPLECSLAGESQRVELVPGSRVRDIYGVGTVEERYQCSFGLNPEYRPALEEAGLRVVGVDTHGTARVVELPQRLFFVATLFQPQLSSSAGRAHPLLRAFVSAADERRASR